MRWFRSQRPWRKTNRVRDAACGTLTSPAGLCDLCRELLTMQPAAVLKADGSPKNTTEDGPVHE